MQTDTQHKTYSKAEEFRLLVADAPIRVTIARQVVIDVNGRRRLRTFPCAIGKLWPVPPHAPPPGADHSASGGSENVHDHIAPGAANAAKWTSAKRASIFTAAPHASSNRRAGAPNAVDLDATDLDAEAYLDWQGEIKPWGEVTSGGFSTSNLVVKVSASHLEICRGAGSSYLPRIPPVCLSPFSGAARLNMNARQLFLFRIAFYIFILHFSFLRVPI